MARPRFGTHAELVAGRATAALTSPPANLAYAEAAALPNGGLLASDFLRRLKVQKGDRILIFGASSAIGTSAVQLARHFSLRAAGRTWEGRKWRC